MGNYRFRLSDMMPNAWFYKLRDMNKLKNQNPPHKKHHFSSSTQIINPRKSFYYTTDSIRTDTNLCQSPHNPKLFDTPFPYDPPPKSSSTNESNRKTIYMPSPRTIAPRETVQNCFDSSEDDCFLESEFEDDDDCDSLYDDDDDEQYSISSCSCNLSSSVSHDIIIDVEESSYTSISVDSFSVVPAPELPPIVTKPTLFTATEKGLEKVKKNRRAARTGRKSVSSKVKIGRRVGGKKAGRSRGKSVEGEKKGRFYSESLAIVKASFDPEKDFRESMMEMIVENNIRESKDLEDLLACYLTLNSNQYHDLIIKAFEQIWFIMPQYN